MKQLKSLFSIILLVLCVFVFSSCSDSDEDDACQEISDIDFVEIGNGTLSGGGKENILASNLVISNETDWQDLMSKMNTVNDVTSRFTETVIDFDQYQIIAVFLNIKGSGWEVEIETVQEEREGIYVYTKEKEFASAVMTQPFCIVKIPKTDKEVRFS